MKKILKLVVKGDCSDLYVTWVNYDVGTKSVKVWFVNILFFVDCLSWNGGTGQIMINKQRLYVEYEKYINKEKVLPDMKEIKEKLINLYDVGMSKHIELKEKQHKDTLEKFKKHIQ
jgi:hypothetical protein